jgi:hypothetical protein
VDIPVPEENFPLEQSRHAVEADALEYDPAKHLEQLNDPFLSW